MGIVHFGFVDVLVVPPRRVKVDVAARTGIEIGENMLGNEGSNLPLGSVNDIVNFVPGSNGVLKVHGINAAVVDEFERKVEFFHDQLIGGENGVVQEFAGGFGRGDMVVVVRVTEAENAERFAAEINVCGNLAFEAGVFFGFFFGNDFFRRRSFRRGLGFFGSVGGAFAARDHGRRDHEQGQQQSESAIFHDGESFLDKIYFPLTERSTGSVRRYPCILQGRPHTDRRP